MANSVSGTFVLYFSFFIAMCLSILPWPQTIAGLMPEWTLLTLMYWSIAIPHRVSVGTGWFIGLLSDALIGSTLGLFAFIYALASWLSHKTYARVRNYLLWQQALIILLFFMSLQTLHLILSSMSQPIENSAMFWLQALTSAMVWPVVFFILRRCRRTFNIA